MIDTKFMPSFKEIEQSGIWLEQIKPWLIEMYQEELESVLPEQDDAHVSLRRLDYKRGFCAALKTIIELPEQAVALEKVQEGQAKRDEAVSAWRQTRTRARSGVA